MSKKINVDQLCADLEALVGKAPYPNSGGGSTKYSDILKGAAVDCSGLLVAAFKNQGGDIYHGSNKIWRQYLSDKGSISDHKSTNGYPKNVNPLKSSQLKKGMAVFKWNSATPSNYKDGLGDYQHVGVVTSVNPLHIVHSTSENDHEGVTMDTKIGKFCAWGYFKDVDYGSNEMIKEEENTTMTGGVLKTVSTMRIRADKKVTSKALGTVPAGTELAFTGDFNDGWVGITYNGIEGYMCVTRSSYAVLVKETAEVAVEDTANLTLEERVEKLEQQVAKLIEAIS